MTNKEILQASLLDILFDNRNKEYGAYVLRRNYNHRLIKAMTVMLSVAATVFLFFSFHRQNLISQDETTNKKPQVVIQTINIPIVKPDDQPKQVTKPIERFAQQKFTDKIEIVKDDILKKTDVPENKDLDSKIISTITTSGLPFDGTQLITQNTNTGNNGNNTTQEETIIKPVEKNPEFPGGSDALRQFLKNNLTTPDELEAGEKKTVQVKFKVGEDGMVSNIEIIQSGGTIFDREVIRVCKKMPHWKPAFQNGNNVAVNYIIPVTFIGLEQ